MTSETCQYFINCILYFTESQLHLAKVDDDEEGEDLDLSRLDNAILSVTKAIRSIQVNNIVLVLEYVCVTVKS